MKHLLFIGLLLLTGAPLSLAQSVSASADKKAVSVGESLAYTIKITNGNGPVQLPDFKGFRVLSGPSVSNMQSFTNGRLSTEYSETYRLQALKVGTFTIAPAVVTVNGKTLTSNKVSIEVVKSAENAERINSSENFFARIKSGSTEVYQGEPVWVSYQVYTAYNDVRNWNMDYSEIDGFWTEECDPDNNLVAKNINGRRLLNAEARRLLLFPQRSGELEISPFTVSAERVVSRGFFNQSREPVTTRSNSRKINVKPLPPGKPENFVGTYLDYDISIRTNRKESPSNEAINVTVTISGKGNMKLVTEPEIEWPADFEVYDPRQTDDISITRVSESGKRSFEYVVIPRSPGDFVIPSIEHAWFNPATERYEKSITDAINLQISRGSESDLGGIFDGGSVVQSEVTRLNKDIRYIKTAASAFSGKPSSFFASPAYWLVSGLPLLMLGLFAFVRKRKLESEADEVGTRQRKAARVAKKYLSQAEGLVGGDKTEFYDTLNQSLMGYLADKLRIPIAEFSRDKLSETLSGRLEASDVSEVLGLVDACSEARYSPVANISPEEALQRTRKVIEKIERS